MGKMVVQISASASVLKDAHEQIKAFPSGAEDRETDPQGREAKHFVQYVINHAQMELEATQAAGLVLNLSSAGGSDKVESETHFWAWDVVRLARLAEAAGVSEACPLDDTTFARAVDDEEEEPAEGAGGSNASEAADDSADFLDELEIARAVGDLPSDGPECGGDEGGELAAGKADEEVDLLSRVFGKTGGMDNKIGRSRTYRAKCGEKIPVSDAHHYAYRDTQLFGFNALEFKKFFRIREMTKKDEEWYAGEQTRLEVERQDERRRAELGAAAPRKSGRPSYRFLLREPHPLHDSWIIVKKEKWGPLIPSGAPPPADPGPPSSNPTDSEERKRRDFARYFVSILVPWDKESPPELTYKRWQEHVAELERDACLRRPLERVDGKEVDGEAGGLRAAKGVG